MAEKIKFNPRRGRVPDMTWMLFWKILFIAVMAVFTLMAVLVSILGARDVRRLIAGLRDGRRGEGIDEADSE